MGTKWRMTEKEEEKGIKERARDRARGETEIDRL